MICTVSSLSIDPDQVLESSCKPALERKEERRLFKLRADGKSIADIAKQLKRTEAAVSVRISLLRRHWFVAPRKPGNSGGGKGPQFKTDAIRGEGPGDWGNLSTPMNVQKLQMAFTRKREVFREPDAGNLPVRRLKRVAEGHLRPG